MTYNIALIITTAAISLSVALALHAWYCAYKTKKLKHSQRALERSHELCMTLGQSMERSLKVPPEVSAAEKVRLLKDVHTHWRACQQVELENKDGMVCDR